MGVIRQSLIQYLETYQLTSAIRLSQAEGPFLLHASPRSESRMKLGQVHQMIPVLVDVGEGGPICAPEAAAVSAARREGQTPLLAAADRRGRGVDPIQLSAGPQGRHCLMGGPAGRSESWVEAGR